MTTAGATHLGGIAVTPHVRRALEDLGDASLTELAAAAWSAEFQQQSAGAVNRLEQQFKKMFGRVFDTVTPERYDRQDPTECVGGECEGLWFSFRNGKLSHVVGCAHKDCPQEVFGPVNGPVELGRVLSLIEDTKEEGETAWRCAKHKKGAVV
jgi:hypothetical protein